MSKLDNNGFVEVAKASEIPNGKTKHIELEGKEIALVNVNGTFYAIADRCGHMNALLSLGNVTENTITCPFHGAKFDVRTGRKIGEPILNPPQEMEPLPKTWQKYMEHIGQLMSHIGTYDQEVYQIKVEGDKIRIKI